MMKHTPEAGCLAYDGTASQVQSKAVSPQSPSPAQLRGRELPARSPWPHLMGLNDKDTLVVSCPRCDRGGLYCSDFVVDTGFWGQ